MNGKDLSQLRLAELSRRVRSGDLSPVALMDATLDRIAAFDGRLKAFVRVSEERARAAAAAAEREIAAGYSRGPLHGLPFGAKDLLASGDVPAEVGMPCFRGRTTARMATPIDRLEAQGAILTGKLRQTEGTFSSYHPDDPVPLNPWNADYFPGASSSGSGIALAARMLPAALSSDSGGSIRVPSALCGVTGIMPSVGRVSLDGAYPVAPTMDRVGPMARSAEDCAMLLAAIAGYDRRDSATLTAPVLNYASLLGQPVAGMVVGIPENALDGVDDQILRAMDDCRAVLERLGVIIETVHFPITTEALTAWVTLCISELAEAHRETFAAHEKHYGPGLRASVLEGRALSPARLSEAALARATLTQAMDRLLNTIDALLLPVMPLAAIPLQGGGQAADRYETYARLGRFLGAFNLTGHPTITFPAGATGEGLPVGLQLAGKRLDEGGLLRLTHAFQCVTQWHCRVPSGYS